MFSVVSALLCALVAASFLPGFAAATPFVATIPTALIQGRFSLQTPRNAQLDWHTDFALKLYPAGSSSADQPLAQYTLTSDGAGSFTTTGLAIAPGSYDLAVKAPTGLSRILRYVNLAEGTNLLDFGRLKLGDVQGDDQVDILDIALLGGQFGRRSGDPQFDLRADLYRDGVVDIADFSAAAFNWGLVGERRAVPPATSTPTASPTPTATSTPTVTATATASAVPGCVPTPSGLLAWWAGDGNANDLVGSNLGTLRGGASFGEGQVGQAFQLDGVDGYVNIPDGPDLNLGTGDFSLNFWVKFASTFGEQVLVEKYIETESAQSTGWVLTKLSSNTLLFGVAGQPSVYLTPASIPLESWIFVAATRSAGFVTLYWNGAALATGTITGSMDSPSSLKIGHRGSPSDTPGSMDSRGFYLNGSVDELQLLGRALSASEIQAIYAAGGAGQCKVDGAPSPTATATPVATVTGTSTATASTTPTATATATPSPTATQTVTYVSGTITANTTWGPSGRVYVVNNDLTVQSGATLTLQAGTVVKFQGSSRALHVSGTLSTQGTSENPVVFTSFKDDAYGGDTDGNGSSSSPAAGDWGTIHLQAGATATLDYTLVRYGGYGYYSWGTTTGFQGALQADGNNITTAVSHSTISFSNNAGIWARGGNLSLTVSDSTISNNGLFSVSGSVANSKNGIHYESYASSNGSPSFVNLTVQNNVGDGIRAINLASATLTGSTFTGNGGYAAYLEFNGNGTLTNSGNSGSGNGKNGISIAGTLLGTTTFPANPNFPYLVDGTLTIPTGSSLTLQPGTVVKFTGTDRKLEVNGTLNAQGSFDNPVVFTSFKDDSHGGDSNNDGSSSSAAAGDWGAISLKSGATGSFDYAIVRYAGYGYYSWSTTTGFQGALQVEGSTTTTVSHSTISYSNNARIWARGGNVSLSVSDSTLANNGLFNGSGAVANSRHGIHYDSSGSTNGSPSFTNLTLQNNVGDGIYALNLASATLTGSTFTGNQGYAAYLEFNGNGTLANSANSGSGNGKNGIRLAGSLSGTTTFPANPSLPYLVDGTLTVPASSNLTLQPGAVVKFTGTDRKLEVNGTFSAQGASGNPVVFTSFKDDNYGGDSNNDATASSPAAGDWGAVVLGSGATGSFDYAVIRYGGYGYTSWWTPTGFNGILQAGGGTTTTVSHSTITHSNNAGIWVRGDNASLTVSYSSISNNGLFSAEGAAALSTDGIHFYGANGTVGIGNNSIVGNVGFGVYNENSAMVLNAENNWWGSAGGPAPYGSGNGINYVDQWDSQLQQNVRHYYVDAVPWLTQPPS